MLEQAKTHGYISDYRGIRISRSGKRFLVEQATVWNIHKPDVNTTGPSRHIFRLDLSVAWITELSVHPNNDRKILPGMIYIITEWSV